MTECQIEGGRHALNGTAPLAKLLLEAWIEKYKPIVNPLAKGQDFASDFMFETYGKDAEHLRSANPACVWTVVEMDTGDDDEQGGESKPGMVILSGFHHVNRIYHFITEVPYEGSESQPLEVEY